MEKLYVVNCKGYTEECFKLVCWLLSDMKSIEVVEIVLNENVAVIKTQDDSSVEKLKKLLSMADMGELF